MDRYSESMPGPAVICGKAAIFENLQKLVGGRHHFQERYDARRESKQAGL
jgi:hypothetical protein